MKKNLILMALLIIPIFSGCQSKSAKLSEMQAKADKNYEDAIFKLGSSLKIYDRKPIGFDEVNESWFYDNIIKSDLLALKESTEESISSWDELAHPLGLGDTDQEALAEVKKEKAKLSEISILLKKAETEKNKCSGNKYYIYKEYLKATVTPEEGKPHNVMDTIKMAFDSDLNPIINKKELPKKIRDFERVIDNLENAAKRP